MLEDKAQPQYSSTIERDRFSWRDQSLFQVPSYDASISELFFFNLAGGSLFGFTLGFR